METKKKTIKVDNMANFEFWIGIFKPRTKEEKMKYLYDLFKDEMILKPDPERADKIKALKFLLGVEE